MLKILPEEEVVEEEEEEEISEAGGTDTQREKSNLHCKRCNRDRSHYASTCKLPWEKIEKETNQAKVKTNDKEKGKSLEFAHYVVAHCNIRVAEDLFNAKLSFWKNDWSFDSRETCHMNFRRNFFEEFTDNFDGAVYFADKPKPNPSRLGIIRLK